MNSFRFLILITISLAFFSCKKHPMEEVESGDWNNERSIIGITFANQVGVATIKRDKDNNGVISFMLNETGIDKTKIKIKNMELSYDATSDFTINDALNFDNSSKSSTITVTSKSGQKRTWTITYIPFTDELVGTWSIKALSVYGGAWPDWGVTATFSNMTDRPWDWKDDGTGAVAEYDNILTFTLEGISDSGDAYGKVINAAGPDGKYANFMFVDKVAVPIDVNNHYRKIPIGESTWKRNSAQGTITFTSGSTVYTTHFIKAGTETLDSQNNSLTVTDNAFTFDLQYSGVWNDNLVYSDRDRIVENPRKYWIQVKKVVN